MRQNAGKFDKYLVFREDFRDLKSVADNGGTISGSSVTIDNGMTEVGANGGFATFGKGLLGYTTKATIIVDLTTPATVSGTIYLGGEFDNGSQCSYFLLGSGGNLLCYIGSAYGYFAIPSSSRIRMVWVYDGTQATANNRLKLYVNGVSQALSYSGTIPTSMTNYGLACNWFSDSVGDNIVPAGYKLNQVAMYKGVSFVLDETLDDYQQDTYSELDVSKALVHLPLKSWYLKENGTQLLTDGDMEAAGVGAWGVAGGGTTLTKSTVSPHTGTQALRITGGAAQYATQTVATVGKRYKITGWARGDGTSYPEIRFGSVVIWTGTTSTLWQNFSCEGVFAVNGVVYLYTEGGVGSNWIEFDDLSIQLMEACTPNIGSLGGVAYLGDKSTPTTFPTQLSPHGMSFDGGDYINTALMTDYVAYNTPFSAIAHLKDWDVVLSANQYFFGTMDAAQNYKGWGAGTYNVGTPSARLFLCNANTGSVLISVIATVPSKINGTLAFTYDGSGVGAGVKIYLNGESLTTTILTDALAGNSIATGKPVLVGGWWNGASVGSLLPNGAKILDAGIYPFVLSPIQIRSWHNTTRKLLNI